MSLAGGLISLYIQLRQAKSVPPGEEARPGPSLNWRMRGGRFSILVLFGLCIAFFVVAWFSLAGTCQSEPPLPTPTPSPSSSTLEVLSPPGSSAVEQEISVQVKTRTLEEGENLVVFVRPKPEDPNQYYFAQQEPVSTDGHRWSASPVFVGVSSDPPGLPFLICAVITQSPIAKGERMLVLPPGEADCVSVTRQ